MVQSGYHVPPPAVVRALEAEPVPFATLSPDGKWLLLVHQPALFPLAEMSGPNPERGAQRRNIFRGYELVDIQTRQLRHVVTPQGYLGFPLWAPDSHRFMFLHTTGSSVQLWIGEPASGISAALDLPYPINGSGMYAPCRWLSDSVRLICLLSLRPPQELKPPAPLRDSGPLVRENRGVPSSDLMATRNAAIVLPSTDELDFLAQPTLIDVRTGAAHALGASGLFESVKPSPDGRYFLAVRKDRADENSRKIDILDEDGNSVKQITGGSASARKNNVSALPREFGWRPDRPASLVYIAAVDLDTPEARDSYRDRLMMIDAPFSGAPVRVFATNGRLGHIAGRQFWGERGLLVVQDRDLATERRRTWAVDTRKPDSKPALLFDNPFDIGKFGDGAPAGVPLTLRGDVSPLDGRPRNARLRQSGDWIYIPDTIQGGDGARAVLDRFNVVSRERQRLFVSMGVRFEQVVDLAGTAQLLVLEEAPGRPPNYQMIELKRGTRIELTRYPHPAPELVNTLHRVIRYTRKDGVKLTADLHMPPEAVQGRRVPVVVWAYPWSYLTAGDAEQTAALPYRFKQGVTFVHGKPNDYMMFLLQGYAVLEAAVPLVGGSNAYDTLPEQIVDSFQAAVNKLIELDIATRDSVGIIGHSWGGMMVATALAHSNIFAAGIARAGVYNLTLSPFGIQDEQRRLWDAPQSYIHASPFFFADRIRAPLLLIHGEADSNPGAPMIQSLQMFEALNGLGRVSRLVILPDADHAFYFSRESILDATWHELDWFGRHLKSGSGGAAYSSSTRTNPLLP